MDSSVGKSLAKQIDLMSEKCGKHGPYRKGRLNMPGALNFFTVRQLLCLTGLFLYCSISIAGEASTNIVIILADDLGYGDVGFHGSDIRTPNLDQFARQGVRLEQFYTAPMCTPTRAGLMTGRYPLRFGMMRSVLPPYRDFGLDPAERTFAETAALAGYKYRGIIGKWHLGHRRTKWHPTSQGFTYFVGCYNGNIDYFTHQRDGELDWHKNGEPYRIEGYSTDIIADAACEFIQSVPATEPYILYVPFNAPHAPFQAKEADLAKYPHREGDKRIYAAMVDCLDQGIGRILETIDRRGDGDNTFILFFSDNGGVKGIGDNGDMRGHKMTVFQGGIRVAAVARWPAGGLSGGGVSHQRMGYIDVHPTIAGLLGESEDPEHPFDGLDVLKAMRGTEKLSDRPWFTYIDQSNDEIERLAVNFDTHKFIIERPAPDNQSTTAFEEYLFQIRIDPGETANWASRDPATVAACMEQIESFLEWKSPNQIPRLAFGRNDLPAPKDWQIDP